MHSCPGSKYFRFVIAIGRTQKLVTHVERNASNVVFDLVKYFINLKTISEASPVNSLDVDWEVLL